MNNIFIVVGLGYGDEGKGSIVDYLTQKYKAETVIRFNGGPQAAHYVVTPKGITHCFSQFGSGTFVPGVKTYLSRYMLVDPLNLEIENSVLKEKAVKDGFERLIIDEKCAIITPFHRIINRMLEISRGENRHGSCGMGFGQVVADLRQLGDRMLFAGDLRDKSITQKKLDFLWRINFDKAEQLTEEQKENERLNDYYLQIARTDYVELLTDAYYKFGKKINIKEKDHLYRILNNEENIIFEGAQGVLLDAERGFWPHVTHSAATFENAEKIICGSGSSTNIVKIGVIRAYGTRHGAGPFVAEDRWLAKQIPDYHNCENEWQGPFRIGWFDLVAVKYALNVIGGVDYIALTNVDRIYNLRKLLVCVAYEYQGKTIDEINIPQPQTREKQIQLTEMLKKCAPIYKQFTPLSGYAEKISIGAKEFISFLEKEIRTPIKIVSFGPTCDEKILID